MTETNTVLSTAFAHCFYDVKISGGTMLVPANWDRSFPEARCGIENILQKYMAHHSLTKIRFGNQSVSTFKNGERHSFDDQPAYIYYSAGVLSDEYWYENGKEHRTGDKPALIYYNPAGSVRSEYWYDNGVLHRSDDKPASIRYNDNGKVESENWYVYGQRHRSEDKPAYIAYNDGKPLYLEYWVNGIDLNKSKEV